MKIKALALLVLAILMSSCSAEMKLRREAGWAEFRRQAEANRQPSWGAYGPYDIYKSPLASPYLYGGSYGMTQPLHHLRQ